MELITSYCLSSWEGSLERASTKTSLFNLNLRISFFRFCAATTTICSECGGMRSVSNPSPSQPSSNTVFRFSSSIFADLSTVDSQLYNNLMFLKTYDGDAEDLCLTFTVTVDDFGGNKEIPLIPKGANIEVTNANKHRYIGK